MRCEHSTDGRTLLSKVSFARNEESDI